MDNVADLTSQIGQSLAGITCFTGIISVILVGFVLDKFRNYKMMLIISMFGGTISLLGMALVLSYTLLSKDLALRLLSASFGLFSVISFPAAFELAAELTFPISEQFSSALLMISAKVWSLIFMYLLRWETTEYSPSLAIFTLASIISLSTIASFFIRPEYKRMYFEGEAS